MNDWSTGLAMQKLEQRAKQIRVKLKCRRILKELTDGKKKNLSPTIPVVAAYPADVG